MMGFAADWMRPTLQKLSVPKNRFYVGIEVDCEAVGNSKMATAFKFSKYRSHEHWMVSTGCTEKSGWRLECATNALLECRIVR